MGIHCKCSAAACNGQTLGRGRATATGRRGIRRPALRQREFPQAVAVFLSPVGGRRDDNAIPERRWLASPFRFPRIHVSSACPSCRPNPTSTLTTCSSAQTVARRRRRRGGLCIRSRRRQRTDAAAAEIGDRRSTPRSCRSAIVRPPAGSASRTFRSSPDMCFCTAMRSSQYRAMATNCVSQCLTGGRRRQPDARSEADPPPDRG